MERIIRGRRLGKTYDLVKYAIEHDCNIICPTIAHRENIQYMANKCFNSKVNVYTIDEWQNLYRGRKNDDYVVDELETIAQFLIGGNMCGWNTSM